MRRPIASRDFAQRAKEMMTYISFHPVKHFFLSFLVGMFFICEKVGIISKPLKSNFLFDLGVKDQDVT